MENEKKIVECDTHLYRTSDNTLVQVYEDIYPDPQNEEHVKAADEGRLLYVDVMGDFPHETEIQDCGWEVIDEPIKDWSDLKEISSKIPYEMDTYIGNIAIDDYERMVPQVVEMWHYAGYDNYDVQIRDMSREYSEITLGVIGQFNALELYDELKDTYGYCYQNDFADRAMDCIKEDLKPWQLDVIREELCDVHSDIEQIKDREYER